jgi:hypothetical protein
VPFPDLRLTVMDAGGKVLARSAILGKSTGWGHAVLVVDLDGTAPAEIVARGHMFRYRGGAAPTVQAAWHQPYRPLPPVPDDDWLISIPVAADLDGDGRIEVVDHMTVRDGMTGADETPPGLLPVSPFPCVDCETRFFTAVADFNVDGNPDLLVVTMDGIQIYDFKAKAPLFTILRGFTSFGGGPPLVADFDGDKVPDFGIANAEEYVAFSLRCLKDPLPAGCRDPGVMWRIPIRDGSSGIIGSTAYDLDGDGLLEIVMRDEFYLRVVGANDGRTLLVRTLTSGTATELPVIADANGDGHADIVVMSDKFHEGVLTPKPEPNTNTAFGGWTRGLFLLTNPSWAPARRVWNQHGYHVTNVNDDLTVPTTEPANWKTLNNERQQRSASTMPPAPSPTPIADLTARLAAPMCDGTAFTLAGTVCNRGAAPPTAPVTATFYDGPPDQGGKILCTAQTSAALKPGECQALSCQIPRATPRMLDLHLRVGDDGKGGRLGPQCKAANDLARLPNTPCGMDPIR